MSKEFVWNIDFDGDVKEWKCVLHDTEVVTYENGEEKKHLKITNPEVKQGVLQIDTVTKVYGMDVPFQLEKNVPYIKLGDKWSMSATTYEDRKKKLLKDQKLAAYLLLGIGLLMGAACLIRYLIEGTMGNWWFLLVMGSLVAVTGFVQYKDLKNNIALLDSEDAQG